MRRYLEEFNHSNREQLTREQPQANQTLAEVSKDQVEHTESTQSSLCLQNHLQTKQLISHKDQIYITRVITTIEITIH